MKRTWIIGSGHGGNTVDGAYVTAPAKMFEHSPEEIFCEGIWNRQVKDLVMSFGWDARMDMIDLIGSELDIPLKVRSGMVNALCAEYPNSFLISIHANASRNHDVNGTEVFAHPSSRISQRYGNMFGEQWKKDFPDLHFRPGRELCKTANFHMLRETHCPAILPECLFYDYYSDYKILDDPDFRVNYAKSIIRFMKRVELENI